MKKRFLIKYKDPDTGETISIVEDFNDSEKFPAKIWAEDLAYSLADKGWYSVTEENETISKKP
jgi:hypothetical protein